MKIIESSIIQKALRISINWDLYRKLLFGDRKEPNLGKKELIVRTVDDAPDGTRGAFNLETKEMIVDIGEIGLLGMFGGKSKKQIDAEITETLAHEGKHVLQNERRGWKMNLDAYIMTLLLVGTLIGCIYLVWMVGFPLVRQLYTKTFGTPSFSMSLMLLLVYFLVVARPIAHVLLKAFIIGKFFIYRASWAERDARKFASDAKRDSKWDDVVKID